MGAHEPPGSPVHGQRAPGRAVVAMLSITVIWGAAFVWMKQALEAGDAWLAIHGPGAASGAPGEAFGLAATIGTFMSARFGAAALVLAVLSRRARTRLDGAAWRGGLVLGGLLVLGFFLQMYGLAAVSPSVSAFLTSLYVLFTAAIEAVLARRAPRLELFLGALLATAGAAYIGGPPQVSFGRGEWLTVASAVVFALHIVLTDRITKRVDPFAVTLASFAVVAVGSLLATAIGLSAEATPRVGDLGELLGDRAFWMPLLLAGTFATLLAITLMNWFQRELDPVRAAIIYAIEPVWAALIAISLGMDEPDTWLYLGGGALLAGNWIAELRLSRPRGP